MRGHVEPGDDWGWVLSLLQHPLMLVTYGGMSQGTDEGLHILDGMPRARMPWGPRLVWGTRAPFRVMLAPSEVLAAGWDGRAGCGRATSI